MEARAAVVLQDLHLRRPVSWSKFSYICMFGFFSGIFGFLSLLEAFVMDNRVDDPPLNPDQSPPVSDDEQLLKSSSTWTPNSQV